MTWKNHGKYTGNYNETWQYDHIIPISNAATEEELIKLNHYSNFQPLCSKKNLEKSNKIK
jgi:5-methylcytosine-specific restriction endonuclease McrA